MGNVVQISIMVSPRPMSKENIVSNEVMKKFFTTKVRRSPRIALNTSFSKFTNTEENPIDITHDVEITHVNEKSKTSADKPKNDDKLQRVDKQGNSSDFKTRAKEIIKIASSPKMTKKDGRIIEVINIGSSSKPKKTREFKKDVEEFFINEKQTSDDDFVSPPVKKVKMTSGAVAKRTKYIEFDGRKIKPRINSEKFYDFISRLTVSQKDEMRELGFGSIVDIKISQIPTGLGFWLLKNFDHETSLLNVGDGIINITPELVNRLLGIPMGETDVTFMLRPRETDDTVREWRSQFSVFQKLISPSWFMTYLADRIDSGRRFALNFLVAFNTFMGKINDSNTVNQGFLTAVKETGNIRNLNWCKYLITLVKNCKERWKDDKEYNGSMMLLAVAYADFRFQQSNNNKSSCPITWVTNKHLEDLEKAKETTLLEASKKVKQTVVAKDIKRKVSKADSKMKNIVLPKRNTDVMGELLQNKFGEKPHVEDEEAVKKDGEAVNKVADSEMKEPAVEVEKLNLLKDSILNYEEDGFTQEDTNIDLTQTDVQVAAQRLADEFQTFENVLSNIQFNLSEALVKYPNSAEIKEQQTHWNYIIHKHFIGFNTKEVGGERTMLATDNKEDGFSPETIKMLDVLDAQISASKEKTPAETSSVFTIPKFDVGSTGKNVEADPVENIEHRKDEQKRPRRLKTISEAMCSPYRERVVQLYTPVIKPEILVTEFIYAAYGGNWEAVFETEDGMAVGSVCMETMRPGLDVHVSVIGAWAEVLNREEAFRKKGSLHRLFCSGVMLFPSHYTCDEKTRLEHFTSNMKSVLNQQKISSLKGVDLVFIPIIYPTRHHFYVMVFNMNTYKIEIIDNIKCDEPFETLYEDWPFIMRDTFSLYLEQEKHKGASKIKKSDLQILDMPWRTRMNFTDCGVFVMRHMETYKATSIKEWAKDCNLSSEYDENGKFSVKQRLEIQELRRKFLAKMLLSDINLSKSMVIKWAMEYDELPKDAKQQLAETAVDRIKERLTHVD